MLIYEHTHKTAIPNILFIIRSSGTQSLTMTVEAVTGPSFSTPMQISVNSYLTPISPPFLFEIKKKNYTLFLESILKALNIIL